MRKAAAPSIQYEVIKLAHSAKSEQTQLQAAQFLLAQEGQGAVQKVDHNLVYDKMPTDQLSAIIMSKIANLEKVIPNFSLERMLLLAKEKSADPKVTTFSLPLQDETDSNFGAE